MRTHHAEGTMLVSEMMTAKVYCCTPDDALTTAAQLMWEHDCGAVVVLDAERRPVGIVTDRDVCMAAHTQGRPLATIAAHVAMGKEPATIRADEPLSACFRVMRERRVRRVPVTDASGRLVGIVSLADLVRHRGRRITSTEVAETIAAICQPRAA
jgi:CBS domain-containing protein